MLVFVLDNAPIAQARPRLGKHGVYNPNKDQKTSAKWQIKQQMKMEPPIFKVEALSIDIIYYLSCPKALSKKEKEERLLNCENHTQRPDIDNLIKFTLDVMQGLVFENDSQVSRLTVKKQWSEKPSTIIYVRELYES